MANRKNHIYVYFIPAILWAGLIFIGSSLPSTSLPSFAKDIQDLVLHFIEYSIFGVFLALASVPSSNRRTWRGYLIVAAIGIVYGASDEIHQKFVSGRYCEFADFVVDSGGIVFGLTLFVMGLRVSEFIKNKKNG
ncbi:MAG: VanZ family protein [bacterium]